LYSLQQIKACGTDWIRSFSDIGLIGDLEVSAREIDELAVSLGRFISRADWDEQVCAALAVVVVNLAYYSPEEIDEGFRWQVLHKLFGQPLQDINLWQDRIGRPVLRLLKRHFYVEDIPGPFRYVRPIMLQAGVPARLSNAFANFFVALSKRHGLQFSEGAYLSGCNEIAVQSAWLKSFLRTNGWYYCQDVARILSRLEKGLITGSDVSRLPQRLRLAVEQIRLMLARSLSVPKTSECIPLPKLVLDRNSLRLAIEFSETGLDGTYRNTDGSRVHTRRYYLQQYDFVDGLKGKINYRNGRSEVWTIYPWRPDNLSWATFRSTDGSIEFSSSDSNGRLVRPGRRLIAVPGTAVIPEEFIVEQLGDLFVPGVINLDIKILECDLPAEFELSHIGFMVGAAGSENFPELRFRDSTNQLPFATNTFVGRLPEIRIEHWRPGLGDKYLLIHDDGVTRRPLPENLYRLQESFLLPLNSPSASGRVFIEPKGRTARGFSQSELQFVLLPEGKLVWPSGLNAPSDTPLIEIEPSNKFIADWQQTTIETESAGRWRVPAKLDYVDGRISFEDRISFYVAGPVYRFAARGQVVKENMLWQNDLEEHSALTLFLSDSECGQRVELGVADRQGFVKCIDLGPVPRNSRLELSTDAIRDAFQSRSPCAGRLAVRVHGTSVVASDIPFLQDALIEERLFDDTDDEFDCWIECVPAALRSVLEKTREMRGRPVASYSLDGLIIPDPLRGFLTAYHACGRILDWDEKTEGLENLQESLGTALGWYHQAKSFIDNGTTVNPIEGARLLNERPKLSCTFSKLTPKQRWRVTFANVLRALRDRKSLADYRRLINEWSSLCRNQRWQAASHSQIGKMPGGRILTDAAEHYFFALEFIESNINKSREYFARANHYLESLLQGKGEGLICELALAVRFMIFFHTQHPQAEHKGMQLINRLGAHWFDFRLTVATLIGHETESLYNNESISLSDFALHESDIQLEKGSRI
jgi:hypothetical protein